MQFLSCFKAVKLHAQCWFISRAQVIHKDTSNMVHVKWICHPNFMDVVPSWLNQWSLLAYAFCISKLDHYWLMKWLIIRLGAFLQNRKVSNSCLDVHIGCERNNKQHRPSLSNRLRIFKTTSRVRGYNNRAAPQPLSNIYRICLRLRLTGWALWNVARILKV